jgi:hypothetical protein
MIEERRRKRVEQREWAARTTRMMESGAAGKGRDKE